MPSMRKMRIRARIKRRERFSWRAGVHPKILDRLVKEIDRWITLAVNKEGPLWARIERRIKRTKQRAES
jgi:hypothetical protein